MLEAEYIRKCRQTSDINEHLPTLREYASRGNSVVECGVRSVVSSYAFACALKGKPGAQMTMVDPVRSPNIDTFIALCAEEGLRPVFYEMSDLKCPLFKTDLLFIDTWHVYPQLKAELARWHPHVRNYIAMHDTTVDEWDGETVRLGMNAEAQSAESGFPVEEIRRGLWPAIEEFLQEHPEWEIDARYRNNNGLTILRRVVPKKTLVLVISDDSHPVYAEHRQLWRETPKPDNVDVYFVEASPSVEKPTLEGDVFRTPGTESFQGIIRKTVDAFDYFLPPGHPYQWIVRTNLSSHYHFPRLHAFLSSKPKWGFYAGFCGYDKTFFAAGAGFYMTPDICAILQARRRELYEIGIIDDVDIGTLLVHRYGIPLDISPPRTDFTEIDQITPESCTGFHYRLKYHIDLDRRLEVEPAMRRRLMQVLGV